MSRAELVERLRREDPCTPECHVWKPTVDCPTCADATIAEFEDAVREEALNRVESTLTQMDWLNVSDFMAAIRARKTMTAPADLCPNVECDSCDEIWPECRMHRQSYPPEDAVFCCACVNKDAPEGAKCKGDHGCCD